MKRVYITSVITAALLVAVLGLYHRSQTGKALEGVLTVGFIYDGDESIPYTHNFALAVRAIEEAYPERLQIYTRSNVLENELDEPIRELAQRGCRILFTNSYSEKFFKMAAAYPDIEFCQVSYLEEPNPSAPANYHTFKGEAFQGRYVSGIAAGMKLKELLDKGTLREDEALVGYVAAFPTAEVISGYTAFFLGIRQIVPDAIMRVRYTQAWSNYDLEKECAEKLIGEGCVILSQHTDTIGPAIACEERYAESPVYFVGYNQSMLDVAPTSALISTRLNWIPYITGAVDAVLNGKKIEKTVKGRVHGHDMSAGFEEDWVQVVDLNTYIAAPGTQERMEEVIAALKKDKIQVFKGEYVGVNPEDETDTIDLSKGFSENALSSSPSFHYVLKDVIVVEES